MNIWQPALAGAVSAATLFSFGGPVFSDQTGVYAIIDEVVFHPNEDNPTTAEIRGVFSVAAGQVGDEYLPAASGYLAFTIEPLQLEQTLAQWRDLAKMAGTNEPVAFSMRYQQKSVRVRPIAAGTGLETTVYPAHMGVRKLQHADYLPIRQLRYVPEQVTPARGAELAVRGGSRPGMRVLFGVHNCRAGDADLRYLFEVTLPGGDTLASPPVEPTKGETSWDVTLALQPGDVITWRVRVLGADLPVVPVATSTFKCVAKQDR